MRDLSLPVLAFWGTDPPRFEGYSSRGQERGSCKGRIHRPLPPCSVLEAEEAAAPLSAHLMTAVSSALDSPEEAAAERLGERSAQVVRLKEGLSGASESPLL